MSRRRRGTMVRAAALVGAAGAAVWAWRRRPRAGRAPAVRLVAPAAADVTPFHRVGTGTPVVLLHGITGTWRMWEPLLPYLAKQHDVFAPTLLGHSGADALAEGVKASMSALVDGVEAALDRAGLQQVHLVGNSVGGWVAIELARRGRARSLVLFSPAGAYSTPRRLASVTRSIQVGLALATRLAPHIDRLVTRPAVRRALLSTQVAHPERVPADVVAATLRASIEATVAPPLLRVLGDTPLEPLPADHDYPIRLVWAEPDRVIPFRHFGEPMLAKLPGAELIRQPGIGHVPMSDDPELVSRLITEVTAAADRAGPRTVIGGPTDR